MCKDQTPNKQQGARNGSIIELKGYSYLKRKDLLCINRLESSEFESWVRDKIGFVWDEGLIWIVMATNNEFVLSFFLAIQSSCVFQTRPRIDASYIGFEKWESWETQPPLSNHVGMGFY